MPIHKERNSLQFTARISVVETEEKKTEEDQEMRVMALGTLSRYMKEMEMEPGWHRLPNGVVAYSDPVATSLLDPRGQIKEAWKARMTLKAFRRIGTSGPQRTLTFFEASAMEDYWEADSEVPVNPFPEERTRAPQGRMDWSEDDREEEEDLEIKMDAQDIEKMVVADRPNEVELDEVIYTDKMPVKELQVACKERGLPYSGSKKRLLDRLMAFRINIQNKMKLNIANKLFREQENQAGPGAVAWMGRGVSKYPARVCEYGRHVLGYITATSNMVLRYGQCPQGLEESSDLAFHRSDLAGGLL